MYPQIESTPKTPKKAFLLTSSNAEMERVLNLARGVAPTPTTVLLAEKVERVKRSLHVIFMSPATDRMPLLLR